MSHRTLGLGGFLWDFSGVLKAAGRNEQREALSPPGPLALSLQLATTLGSLQTRHRTTAAAKATPLAVGLKNSRLFELHQPGARRPPVPSPHAEFHTDPVPRQARAPPPNPQG